MGVVAKQPLGGWPIVKFDFPGTADYNPYVASRSMAEEPRVPATFIDRFRTTV